MAKLNVESYSPTKTTKFFYRICEFIYFCSSTNFWFEELKLSKTFVKIYDHFSKIMNILVLTFLVMELGSFLTQNHLSEKLAADRLLFCVSHPLMYMYIINLKYYKDKISEIILHLSVQLKEIYNDLGVEREMIMNCKVYGFAYLWVMGMALFSYGVDGLIQVVTTGAPFTTVITAWPDVEDLSKSADFVRVINYIVWWIFVCRVFTIFLILATIVICLSHQFKNLQSYFYKLNDIFDNEDLDQEAKEEEYEAALKVGIRMHSETLWCTKQSEEASSVVFSGQVILNTGLLGWLLVQFVSSERTLSGTLTLLMTMASILLCTGLIMWSAGDVTVEASLLPTAVYSSGWQHCRREAALRIRPLLVFAMMRSQLPVEMQCLGIIKLSYSSYVSIVKSSYSVFSVLY